MFKIDNFPKNEDNFIKKGKDKVKKAAQIGALGLGIGSSVIIETDKIEAQTVSPLKMKITINQPGIKTMDIRPDDYDFRNIAPLDLRDLEGKKSLDSNVINRVMLESLKKSAVYYESWSAGLTLGFAESDVSEIAEKIKRIEKPGDKIQFELSRELEAAKEKLQRSKERFNLSKEEETKAKNLQFDEITIKLTNQDKEYLKLAPALFRQIEDARQEAKRLVGDKSSLKKLEGEFQCSPKEAARHQQVRLSNINLANYDLLTVQELRNSLSKSSDNFHNAIGYADRSRNKIEIPYNLREELTTPDYEFSQADFEKKIYEIALHEFLHLATGSNRGLSPQTVDLLSKLSFKKYSKEEIKSNSENNNYHSDPTERYVRFKSLESELAAHGVKKIGEEFTLEHYKKMIALYREGKLLSDANEFIKYTQDFDTNTGYKIFKKLFDKIALLNNPGENNKTYYHSGWDYEDKEKKA